MSEMDARDRNQVAWMRRARIDSGGPTDAEVQKYYPHLVEALAEAEATTTPRRPLTFDEFSERTVPLRTPDGPPLLWAAGLGGEAGEVMEAAVEVVVHAGRAQDATKKIERDQGGADVHGRTVDRDEQLRKECGNVLFYVDRLMHSRGMTMEDAALAQIEAMEGMRP